MKATLPTWCINLAAVIALSALATVALPARADVIQSFTCSGQMATAQSGQRIPAWFYISDLGNGQASYYLEAQGRVISNGVGNGSFSQYGASVGFQTTIDTPYAYPAELRVGMVTNGPTAGTWQGVFYFNFSSWAWFTNCRAEPVAVF